MMIKYLIKMEEDGSKLDEEALYNDIKESIKLKKFT